MSICYCLSKIRNDLLLLKVLMDAMILSVMYIWCQLNKETMMSFWFGMQFKAMYMPWVIMLFNWILSGSYVFSYKTIN